MKQAVKTALVFICLLAGHEAARISADTNMSAVSRRVPDLDWPGCGKKLSWGASCDSVEGCARSFLWLDTPGQSCRFTDDHKLEADNVATFLPVELARLEEKTATFAKRGCIFGGLWVKCYRRTLQLFRLGNYVRKAIDQARKDPAHPSHELATSDATTAALKRVSENLAKGFEKRGQSFDFSAAVQQLQDMEQSLAISEEDETSTLHEKLIAEKVGASSAMLAMVGVELTEDQKAELAARIEAEGEVEEMAIGEMESAFDEQVSGLSKMLEEASASDIDALQEQEVIEGEDDDDEEESLLEGSSQAELASVQHQNASGRALAERGTGPLKWLFKHGIGWLATRIAWVLLYVISFALGLVRAAAFILFFATCVLAKFLSWIFVDIGYGFLWEGENPFPKSLEIGKCTPMMWDAMGFDSSAEETLGQIFIQPAQFATSVTGVHHPLYDDMCKYHEITCGRSATCINGQCVCDAGYYPPSKEQKASGVKATDCVRRPTENGCVCKTYWEENGFLGLQKHGHYGCPTKRKCEIDQRHASFRDCQASLSDKVPQKEWKMIVNMLGEKVFGAGKKPLTDNCRYASARKKIREVSRKEPQS